MPAFLDAEVRFWVHVKSSRDGCWEWTAHRNVKGYGRFGLTSRKLILTHRYSWQLHFGQIPDGILVLHRCDNPSCVRPDHLFLGSNDDNMQEMKNKGRASRLVGSKNPRAILSEQDVVEIRSEYDSALIKRGINKSLSSRFGVSVSVIENVVYRRFWKHVPESRVLRKVKG